MVQVLKSEWGHSAGLGNMGRAAKRRVGLFARDEEGSLVVFGMFCLIMMILVAGVGLDVFRFEEKRVAMQNTIDRAVLAAADLDQTLAPKDIVKDYFVKAGLNAPADNQITVVDSASGFGRSISVTTSEIVPTWFMRALGFNTLTARLTSAAEENQTRVEISLVLDVSGSMNSSNRLTNMKAAATDFVTQVLSGSTDGNVSVSVIPYATQVSAGTDILNYLNVTSEHSNSNCLEFDPVDYENTQLEMKATVGAKTYQRNGNFDPFYTHDRADPDWLPNCPTGTARDIQPFSTDAAALNAYINSLTAEGNTSIEIGIKWGIALLDPTLQPLGAGLAAEGKISADVADRPLDYGQPDVMKVLVVMTDGQNTTEYRLSSGYRAPTDMSFFYRKDVLEDADQPYDTDNLVMYYNRSGTKDWYKFGSDSGWKDAMPTGYHQLSWTEMFNDYSVKFIEDMINTHVSNGAGNSWKNAATNYVSASKDGMVTSSCTHARQSQRGILIFTIAFDAPRQGQTLLKNCATSPSYYYFVKSDGTGMTISTAFAQIANIISKLRLTQ